MILIRRPRTQWPPGVPRVDQRWIARGLKSLYLLRSDIWKINLVTGLVGGAVAGSGPTFTSGWLQTPGTVSVGATLQHGLSVDIAPPISIVAGWQRLSGVASWSLLDNVAEWTGWYGQSTGEVIVTNSNSFDGALALASHNVAFSHVAANNLRGSGGTGVIVDSTATTPSAVSPTTVALGWARRSGEDNAAAARFTHWGAFQGALTDDELQELGAYPMRLLEPQRIFVPMQVASSGLPTLTGITLSNITTSGYRATVAGS